MKVRGLILGDSHITAFKGGWDAISSRYPNVAIDMFGAATRGLDTVHLKNGILTSPVKNVQKAFKRTGGCSAIDLRGYDFYCIVGCATSNSPIAAVGASSRVDTKAPSPKTLISESYMADLKAVYSQAVFAGRLVRLIRAMSDKKIYVFPTPYRALAGLRPRLRRLFRNIDRVKEGLTIEPMFQQYLTGILGPDATIIHQPRETTEDGIFTKEEYLKGATRLRTGLEYKNDFAHMNTEFGILRIEQLMKLVI